MGPQQIQQQIYRYNRVQSKKQIKFIHALINVKSHCNGDFYLRFVKKDSDLIKVAKRVFEKECGGYFYLKRTFGEFIEYPSFQRLHYGERPYIKIITNDEDLPF